MGQKKRFLLRLDERLYQVLEKWSADELRSVNAQIEYLLADAVKKSGRSIGRESAGDRRSELEDISASPPIGEADDDIAK
jgi:hypothetical protein